MKIMIVCYDAELAALTAKSLSRQGYEVFCCTDVSKTEELVYSENVQLVIADLETDEKEGMQFCKSIKKIQNPPKLLFIGSSGEEESRVLNAGADDWIKKPYKTAVFFARISALLRQSEYVSKQTEKEDLVI